jgi:putative addiction module CopG family antidote
MDVSIPGDLEDFVVELVRTGSYHDPTEVVGEALQAFKKQKELRQAIQAGMDELDRGQYVEYDDSSLTQFVKDIKTIETSRYAGKDKTG